MNKEYRVFISSTNDLAAERTEAMRAVLTLNCTPVSMENWAATGDPPTERIKEKLATCDVLILLAGFRYGTTIDDTRISFVESEYDQAISLGLRIVILLKDGEEADDAQKGFRERLSSKHTTQNWQQPAEVTRLVMGSLFEIIVNRQSASVFCKNVDLVPQIDHYLYVAKRLKNKLKAHIIQYSAVNALELVRTFVWEDVATDLYIVSQTSRHIINIRQGQRRDETVKDLLNNLRRHGEEVNKALLKVWGYDTPGSIRGVMVERIQEDGTAVPDFLAIGTYLYMKIPDLMDQGLDIRGGELPGLVLRPKHDGFDVHARMVCRLLKNWHDHEICHEITLGSDNASAPPSPDLSR